MKCLNFSVKKEVKQLHGYEASFLKAYKNYLNKLEKMISILKKKKGDSRVFEEVCLISEYLTHSGIVLLASGHFCFPSPPAVSPICLMKYSASHEEEQAQLIS